MVEEEQSRRREKVYVAVGRSEDKAVSLLLWTLRTFRSYEICLVHVHQPSAFIPTPLGKLPAKQANGEVVATYRREEKEQMKRVLLTYLNICYKAKVKASIFNTEAEDVQKGLLDLIVKHGIEKLVMGSAPENCMKVKKGSRKANHAARNAPAYCEIFFIYKGKHVWTREAFEEVPIIASCHTNELITESSRSKSFGYSRSERLYNPGYLRTNSSRLSLRRSGTIDLVQKEHTEEDWLLPCTLSSSVNSYENLYVRSSTKNDAASSTYAERRISSDYDSKLKEIFLSGQLLEAKADAETSKHETLVEILKRKELEAEAIQTIRKVKDIESAHTREAELRKEAEEAIRSMMLEQEKLLEERLELSGELQKTMRMVAVLDNRVQEANRRCDEAAGELKLIQVCIASLRQEKQRIQRQKIEAERWLEKWRSRRQAGSSNRNGNAGFLDDVPELVEFSLFDLQTATCNFSDSFKIGEGGYGCIYKGELLDRTVAIQRLPAHNIQSPLQFQKEVQILGKLRHPYLVNLIGMCPEAWSLVYDYLPNGTLQYRLLHRSNIEPLSWKIRTRIISEISMALLFLHSSDPEKIVHGDLKPEAILLDSDLHCRICDFGTSRLLSDDTLRCPSFRCYPEPKGAFPYTDPEFHRTGKLSPKSDLYSFGIIILQLLTGQSSVVGLVANVRKVVSCGKLASILDSSAGDWGPFVAEKLADIGLGFCEPNSRDRPELTPSLVKELQQLHISEDRPVPSFFVCPIVQEMMCDPQVAADGFTYEGEAIREWFENGRETSPMTNLRLDHPHLTPNHSLRLSIHEWLCSV